MKYGAVRSGNGKVKFGIAKVAKRFGQQRHSFVLMSKGIGVLRHAAFSNGAAKWSGVA